MVPILLLWAGVGGHDFGLLPPAPLPDITVTTEQGQSLPLRELVRGRAVALQFIFTDCTTACPLLASLFRSVEKHVLDADGIMLLSVSVNPERDDAGRLSQWLKDYRRGAQWRAVRTGGPGLESLLNAFGQKSGPAASHSTQVFFVNRKGEVFGRTTALPDAAGVAAILKRIP